MNKRIKDILPTPTDEYNVITKSFNSTAAAYPKDKCVHQLIELQADYNPQKPAVIAVDGALTFGELNHKANQIAHSLISLGIGKGAIVAVLLPRTSLLLPAMLGVLKTGAAYMPIDPSYPRERIDYLLSESRSKYCIDESTIETLCSNTKIDNLNMPVSMSDYFCALHTSGSTGKPKLTVLRQQNLLNFLFANTDFWEDVDTVISVTIVTFDIFMQDTLLSLALGKKVVLASNDQIFNQAEFEKMFENEENVMFFSTPTKLMSYIKGSETAAFLKKIRSLIVGGEVFTDELYDLIVEKLNTVETGGIDSQPCTPPRKIPNQNIQRIRTDGNNTWSDILVPLSSIRSNSAKQSSMHMGQLKPLFGLQKRLIISNIYGPAETTMWVSKDIKNIDI